MRQKTWRRLFLASFIALLMVVTSLIQLVVAAPLHFDEGKAWYEVNSNDTAFSDGSPPTLADVNGDSKADLIVYNSYYGQAWVSLSIGSSFAFPKLWAYGLPTQKESPDLSSGNGLYDYSVADVDGDKKADLTIFLHGDGEAVGSANVYVLLSNGSSFQYGFNSVWNDGFCIGEQVCKVADVNGDGKADLVAFTPITGLVWTSLSLGNKFGENAVWHNYFCIKDEVCEVGDVDGDKKADLILFKPHASGVQKGNVLIAPSTGQNFGQARLGHGFFCIDQEICLVADANGDGKADVLLVKQASEVLVSLSNGQQFINANPFKWGNVGGNAQLLNGKGFVIHRFSVGDVTGDGRSDLLYKESVGGGSTGKLFFVVSTATDQEPTSSKPGQTGGSGSGQTGGSGSGQAQDGFRQLNFYNCDPNQHRFYYWVNDATANSVQTYGPIDAMYSEAGGCPDPQDEPFKLSLTNGHFYGITAVAPEALNCNGQNDPTILSCIVQSFSFKGNDKGGVLPVIIPATQLSLLSLTSEKLSLTTKVVTPSTAQGLLQALQAINIDYSVTESQILDWLGNSYSLYPQFAKGCLKLLGGKHLKKNVYLDVIFWNYKELGGKITSNSGDGSLDTKILKKAMLEGYITRNGSKILSFEDIVE